MLILEQCFIPHAISPRSTSSENSVEYNLDQTDIETLSTPHTSTEASNASKPPVQVMTSPLTLGLIIHSLADGLALGASASGENSSDTNLSLVVFIALIIHKCLPPSKLFPYL